jgi:hypothetical protein
MSLQLLAALLLTHLLPLLQIFGWFLEPGRLYDLQLDPQLPSQEDLQQRHHKLQQQHQHTKKKQKKRSRGAAADGAAAAAAAEQGLQQNVGAAGGAKSHKMKRRKLEQASGQQQQQPSEQQQQRQRLPAASIDGAAQAVQFVLPSSRKAGHSTKKKKAAKGSGLHTKAGTHKHGSKTKLL